MSRRCVRCESVGNGKCAACYGSGADVHLNSGETYCQDCGGTALCPYCEGSGCADFALTDLIPDWITRLFH